MTLADYQAEKARLKQEIRFVKGKQDFYMERATKCTMSYEPRIGKTETRNLQPMESAVVDMIPYSEQLDTRNHRTFRSCCLAILWTAARCRWLTWLPGKVSRRMYWLL